MTAIRYVHYLLLSLTLFTGRTVYHVFAHSSKMHGVMYCPGLWKLSL